MSWFRWKIICYGALVLFLFLYLILSFWGHRDQKQILPKTSSTGLQTTRSINTTCPTSVSNNSITPITGSRNVMVSAFINEQTGGQVLVLSIMNVTDPKKFYCVFYCTSHNLSVSSVTSEIREDHFGFPFVTTHAFCRTEPSCNATHVSISAPENINKSLQYLPIQVSQGYRGDFEVTFTLCISTMFEKYNNVLQFVQTIETYRLLGVERVVVYNTSCGSDLEKVLLHYKEEGLLEIIPWPIHNFFEPSKGWLYELHGGELHYYGQQATLNDCVHRNRERSKYVLLSDADEIIMPYIHSSLNQLIKELQDKNPNVATFIFSTFCHYEVFTNTSKIFDLPQWRHIPGVNILRYIYREPPNTATFDLSKMIVNPRKILQTSIHRMLKSSGGTFRVPDDLAHVMHNSKVKQPKSMDSLVMNKIIWKYAERLISNVDRVVKKAGLLTSV